MRSQKMSLACVTAVSLGGEATLQGQDGQARAEGQEAALLVVLRSNASEKDKADACLQLARVGTKASVGPLAALLGDEKLSHMARYALSRSQTRQWMMRCETRLVKSRAATWSVSSAVSECGTT